MVRRRGVPTSLLTEKGRALITKIFREHAAAMEDAAGVLSKEERLMLLRLLKKLGKGETQTGTE
jgi:DNA-binding MarR family transcriptional regulator